MWKRERKECTRKSELFHSFFSPQFTAINGAGCLNSIRVSNGSDVPACGSASVVFLGVWAGSWIIMSAAGPGTNTYVWDAIAMSSSLTKIATILTGQAPFVCYFPDDNAAVFFNFWFTYILMQFLLKIQGLWRSCLLFLKLKTVQ